LPFFGSRKMAVELGVGRDRARRLMRILEIEAHYPKLHLGRPAAGHQIYPYLLCGVAIERTNQVWSTDIVYIPMSGGFLYLVAVMDWFSRFVLSWELSNTMETGFCLAALDAAFRFGQSEIWNSDQGSQFTSADFLDPLQRRGILISMGGRGRALANAFIARLWRSLKYELIYPGDFAKWPRTVPGSGELLPLLQSPASAPGARLSDAAKPVPSLVQEEEVILLMGNAVPQTPWNLPLLFSRMDAFRFTRCGDFRQIDLLASRIGQRGDAI
jgi:putative transposase